MKHYQEKLSAYLHYELPNDERQKIAEHLSLCVECRDEHDMQLNGMSLAANLRQADAPRSVWAGIEEKLDGKEAPQMGLMRQTAFFNLRKGFAFVTALIVVSALPVLVYLGLFSGDTTHIVQQTNQNNSVNISQLPTNIHANVPANVEPDNTNVNTSNTNQMTTQPSADVWQVETIAGTPKVGDGTEAQIAVGELLETDARSSARITVANIGSVDVAPNSRVKLVGTGKAEHRLSLEQGRLHAKIFAPPRLFVVDTPSGKAVDLGCEYTLEVDKKGNTVLHVTGGYVALERSGRESIVPAGMMCTIKQGKGLGTPFSGDATEGFRRSLEQFDFSNGGSTALQAVLKEADFYDMFTLWHLLSRVSKNDRAAVYDELVKFVKPPSGVTREGVIALDKKMLELWRVEVETAWFS